jgi:cytoskeleton protein RodZ
MTSIGETLRGERVRRELDLQSISRDLKIPAKFLEAIEREQFDTLPAAVFARSFVRQYARYLGLHEEDMVEALQHILEPPPSIAATPADRMEPPAIQVDRMAEWQTVGERRPWSSSLPALALVVVVMLGCSGVYAWWQRGRHAVSAHESAAAAARPQDLTPVTAQAPPTSAVPSPSANADHGAAQSASTPTPVSSPQQAAKTPGEAERTDAPARSGGPVHVELTASSLVWIFAKADGKTSFTGTLESGQSRTFDAQDQVVVRLGNAGGAKIKLNGKPIGSVGANGMPCTVQLTSGGFQIVAPPKSPDLLLDPLG